MRKLLATALLTCLPFFAHAADEDTPATRRVQAERYMQVSDLQGLMSQMTDAVARDLPPDKAEEVRNILTRHVRIEALQEAMLIVMVKHFTTRELSALADFYGSAEGKSAMSKFGLYMSDIMPLLQAEIQHAMESARAEKAAKGKGPGS